MYQAKELIETAIRKLNIKPFKIDKRASANLKYEEIIQLYQHPYTEDEIASLLYPKGKDQNFRKLKSRMVEKSVELILSQSSSVKLSSSYDKNIVSVHRLFLVANLLIMKDNRTVGDSLYKKALRISKAIQYTPYIIQISRALCYASAYKGSQKELISYHKSIEDNMPIYFNEIEIDGIYAKLLIQVANSAEYSKKVKEEINNAYAKISAVLTKYRSHQLNLLYFRIGIMYFHSQHAFENIIHHSKKAINYLNSNVHLNQNARLGEFSLYEMDACLRLKDYKKGAECAIRCLKFIIPYTSAWSIFNEYHFLLAMRTANYKKAEEIVELINSSNYKLAKMLPRQRDKWKMYEAFLHFTRNKLSSIKQFNLFKYLNDLKLIDKDKAGYNYSILISKVLLLINSGDYNALENMEDSFKIYFKRYIDKTEYPRHYEFGKFLIDLFKVNFDPIHIKMKIHLESLKNQMLEETEVIPYDVLMDLVLERCKNLL